MEMWFICLVSYTICALTTVSGHKNTFLQLVAHYKEACPPSSAPAPIGTMQRCCGFCSHDVRCAEFDNCCFDEYNHMAQALGYRYAKSQSKACVLPMLDLDTATAADTTTSTISSTAYWMKTKCQLPDSNLIDVKLCSNPGMNNHYSSIVPTFNGGNDQRLLPFWNKFCSKCDGLKNEAHRHYWILSVHCDDDIVFNHENLLQVVQEKKCKVSYKPPSTAAPQCDYSGDSAISRCNVTGLWEEYDNVIEAACHSFYDTFNGTYRNYFCYLCNTDDPQPPELRSCDGLQKRQNFSDFLYSVDFTVDLISQIDDGVMLGCDAESQFADLKKMVCRSFHCNGFSYDENTCKPIRIERDTSCLVASVRMTFGVKRRITKQQLDEKLLWNAIKNDLVSPPFYKDQIKEMKVYLRTMNEGGVSLVDYLVLQLYIDEASFATRRDLEEFVNHIHGRPCYVGFVDVFPWCEMIIYDADTVQDQEIIEPVVTTHKPDVKRSLSYVPSGYCGDKEIRLVNKLYFCIHVRLSTDELYTEIDDNILKITINSNQVYTFSPWEYEFTNGVVKLCMEDYLLIYKAMPALGKENGFMRNEAAKMSSFSAVMATFTFLSISFVHFNQSDVRD